MRELREQLVAAAVLGVERRPFSSPPIEGALGDLIRQLLSMADSEGALLGAAAAAALFRRTGLLPPRQEAPLLDACEEDDLPACTPRAARHLAAMLGGTHRALLPEWLAALAATRRRAPAALLPDLLELGRAQADLREAVLPVLDRRGRWLAAQNPDWSYARTELRGLRTESATEPLSPQSSVLSAESATEPLSPQSSVLIPGWETGSRPARLALLAELRRFAPAMARGLIESTWGTERADDRAAFLSALAVGLSMDDEPFLEGALDDRGKEVRRAAAELLERMPESRRARRMLDRALPLLAWAPAEKPRMLGLRQGQKARLDVALPDACDQAMIRDGVERKPPADRQGTGERAWWLLQLLCAVPPATWTRQFSITPDELIAAAEGGEWRALLHEAWGAAAIAFQDAVWAESLLRADQRQADLLAVLPPARQEALLLAMLRGDVTPLHKHPVLVLLRRTRHDWSAELTRAVLGAVRRHMRAANAGNDYQLRGAISEDFARRMPPAMLEEIAAGWPDDEDARERWQGVIDRLLITLQFRRDMLRALREV